MTRSTSKICHALLIVSMDRAPDRAQTTAAASNHVIRSFWWCQLKLIPLFIAAFGSVLSMSLTHLDAFAHTSLSHSSCYNPFVSVCLFLWLPDQICSIRAIGGITRNFDTFEVPTASHKVGGTVRGGLRSIFLEEPPRRRT